MANVTNLKQGSKGSDVKKLQQTLIEKGYDVGGTGADGVFGKNTLAAVKQYQKDNKLAVDGIAGKNTLGSLYSTGSQKTNGTTGTGAKATGTGTGGAKTGGNADKPEAPTTGEPPAPGANPVTSPDGFTYGDFYYAPFDPMADPEISQANTILNQLAANKPGEWLDPYKDKWLGYADQYENRDPFSYDFNSDALYNMYKDQYIQQGQMAMMDTMGQAAAMTGGYGNSYAQTVGQQVYNQQLSQLNEIMPELYGMAYDRYNQEGQKLLDMYSLYKGLSNESYGMHQDSLENWYRDVGLATDNYNTAYNRGWDNYILGYNTSLNEYNTSRSEAFTTEQNEKNQAFTAEENQKSRDFTASENDKSRAESNKANAKSDLINLITSTGYDPSDAELNAAGMTREQAKGYLNSYNSSKSSQPPTYLKLEAGSDAYKYIDKEIQGAESLDALKTIAQKYAALGYDPAVIEVMTQNKLKELTPKLRDLPNPTGVGGGGGGGVMRAEAR